jgi:thioester reductase-like protein
MESPFTALIERRNKAEIHLARLRTQIETYQKGKALLTKQILVKASNLLNTFGLSDEDIKELLNHDK